MGFLTFDSVHKLLLKFDHSKEVFVKSNLFAVVLFARERWVRARGCRNLQPRPVTGHNAKVAQGKEGGVEKARY